MNKFQQVLIQIIYIVLLPLLSIYQLFFDIKPRRNQIVKKFKGSMVLIFCSILLFLVTLISVTYFLEVNKNAKTAIEEAL